MGDAQPQKDQRDARFMGRAIKLASKGAGLVSPNPMVGCVLVQGETIVGEGWHARAGGPHAEIEALAAAGDKARGATAYVSLEPCNHHGRTGPCAEALIEAGISKVVYAITDPNRQAGGGADRLMAAGVKVRSGVREAEARHLNRAWLHAQATGRPFVIGKSGMSLDGRIATQSGESNWITSEESRAEAHRLRAEADAIIVGAGTVIADDPALTARLANETRQPLRVVLDSAARTSPGAHVFERSGKGAILATTEAAPHERLTAFREMGVETLILPRDNKGRPDLESLLEALHGRDVVTAMIEGGGVVLGAFFDADLIDELALFIAPKIIGGGKPGFAGEGVSRLADSERFEFAAPEQCGPDLILRGARRKREAR